MARRRSPTVLRRSAALARGRDVDLVRSARPEEPGTSRHAGGASSEPPRHAVREGRDRGDRAFPGPTGGQGKVAVCCRSDLDPSDADRAGLDRFDSPSPRRPATSTSSATYRIRSTCASSSTRRRAIRMRWGLDHAAYVRIGSVRRSPPHHRLPGADVRGDALVSDVDHECRR
jgi:hypothetical protein